MKNIFYGYLFTTFFSLLVFSNNVLANERHFTYTYETDVLPKGMKEIELWSTPRFGRENYYFRFDQRIEYEVGVTNKLMTAFYLNYSATTQEIAGEDEFANSFSFKGVSSEWKYKVLDSVDDMFGFALYGEGTLDTDEIELEGKLLFDKWVGNWLWAANIVGEYELEFEKADEIEKELILVFDLGLAYKIQQGLTLGVEMTNHNEIVEGELEHSALFGGPVLAYGTKDWWTALSIMPQLPAIKAHDGDTLDLHEHERINARLLFSLVL